MRALARTGSITFILHLMVPNQIPHTKQSTPNDLNANDLVHELQCNKRLKVYNKCLILYTHKRKCSKGTYFLCIFIFAKFQNFQVE